LVGYFNDLPEPRAGEDPRRWERRLQEALDGFRIKVAERYTEGTLQRLLDSSGPKSRRAATLAVGLIGTMESNQALASRLHDEDGPVRQLAADALWSLWFRADGEANNAELQRLMRLGDRAEALTGFDRLIKRAPSFAEAYNQRAILHFQLKDYTKSIADCEKVLQLNPFHFGACGGMAQCYLNLRRPRAALKAFRETFRINPNLKGIEETIRDLESVLGEEGKRDEKK
jgi:tetratricopeptide (TPR) repeat protein